MTDGYHHGMAEELEDSDRQALIIAIAGREGTIDQLEQWFGVTEEFLEAFVHENLTAIQLAKEALDRGEAAEDEDVSPKKLDELWISKKAARLTRYQAVADSLYQKALKSADTTVLREFRAYLQAAANELGQLMHRGSGDAGEGDILSVRWEGVNPDRLR